MSLLYCNMFSILSPHTPVFHKCRQHNSGQKNESKGLTLLGLFNVLSTWINSCVYYLLRALPLKRKMNLPSTQVPSNSPMSALRPPCLSGLEADQSGSDPSSAPVLGVLGQPGTCLLNLREEALAAGNGGKAGGLGTCERGGSSLSIILRDI